MLNQATPKKCVQSLSRPDKILDTLNDLEGQFDVLSSVVFGKGARTMAGKYLFL